jgi:hypothetical protein
MTKRAFLIVVRLVLGLATLTAVVIQGLHLHQAGSFNPANYFGYFTNLSNILAAGILIISAVYLMQSRKPSGTDDLLRGAATLYMAITGVVYAVLLSGEDLGLLLPWVNILLHIIMPLAVVADWIYQPPRAKLSLRQLPYWLIFPGVFLIYTLIRGAVVHWYPYPFLNPDKVDGYGGVALYSLGVLGAFMALGWLLMRLSSLLPRKRV